MPAIGLVDDRQEIRETTTEQIKMALPNKWECIDTDPFPEMRDYNAWITENNISVLVLDQRLNEQGSRSQTRVSYKGHKLVDYLRQHFPTIPIYIVSTYIEDEDDIKRRFSQVEELILRQDFTRSYKQYVPRMVRAAQQYINSLEDDLSSLAKLSKLSATGAATPKNLNRLNAIRQKLNLAFPSAEYMNNQALLSELSETLKKMQGLKSKIQKHLQTK